MLALLGDAGHRLKCLLKNDRLYKSHVSEENVLFIEVNMTEADNFMMRLLTSDNSSLAFYVKNGHWLNCFAYLVLRLDALHNLEYHKPPEPESRSPHLQQVSSPEEDSSDDDTPTQFDLDLRRSALHPIVVKESILVPGKGRSTLGA